MYGSKIKLLDELMEHLGNSQGSDLKSLLDESKKPPMEMEEDPKGLKIQSVELMGKDPEITDVADASDGKKTLGESIGYPGFPKGKAMEDAPGEVAMNDGERELDDDEIAQLLSKYV
jgi:hypothetical protein